MKKSASSLCCLFALTLAASASAQVLMLDFGPTAATTTNLTNSAYHAANTSFTDDDWNTRGTGDAAAGSLVWSTGLIAAGISLNTGATTDGTSTTIGLGNTPSSSSALGNNVNTGIYDGDSVLKDAIFTGSTGNTRAVGIQVGGLSAGTYDIYVSGRNTNTAATHSQNFYAGTSATAVNFDYSLYTANHATLSYVNATSAVTSWSAGANYAKFSITLSSGDFLNIAAAGGPGELRGFLSFVQIVKTSSIPEPSTYALLTGLGGVILVSLRRRRRAG